MPHHTFYDFKHHLKLFWLGCAVKPGKEQGHLIYQLNNKCQQSAKKARTEKLLTTLNIQIHLNINTPTKSPSS